MKDLGISGKCVQSMQLQYTLVLQLSDVYFIAISSPFVVEIDGRSARLSPEEDPEGSFEPVRELIGLTVESGIADQLGALNVVFEGGARLHVKADPAYEAWNVSGPEGALVVSMPGGELATWGAQPGGDES